MMHPIACLSVLFLLSTSISEINFSRAFHINASYAISITWISRAATSTTITLDPHSRTSGIFQSFLDKCPAIGQAWNFDR